MRGGVPTSLDGGEAGYPWPNCAPNLPVSCISLTPGCPPGSPVAEAGQEIDQEPAIYDDAGNIIPAPDGSACATYPWLGSTAIDKCTTANWSPPTPDISAFPPCNWCLEAGTATAGPGVGVGRYLNCILLYECMVSTGCAANPTGVQACLCGDAAVTNCTGSGPCGTAELTALERANSTAGIQDALQNFENGTTTDQHGAMNPGYCAGSLNYVYQIGQSYKCFVDASAY
jgi:hypothetical protein